ncbi:hypothetical protein CQ020_01935 [Arthrobacter sp. MYb23]|uniref:hypothetical protein n=1 Tax=unclassified Arthrobacter TaxID=235627 RepID=UPI000CFC020D|nr:MULTISPECIES: hypothetical protein [unclassified Arthrobacter]PRB44971.1 hypothetical protein CQ038_00845 [Arthrobacter sp. MYb51]PRB99566.1 hypothetical protein CQ020_01935 [Arthrobacter sp. MYb23]
MRKYLSAAASFAAATLILSGCAQAHDDAKASDLGITFAYSLAGHNGKFCDHLDSSSEQTVDECKKSEAEAAAKQQADQEPIIWVPKIYQLIPGKEEVLGIVVEFNRAGNQEFVVIEAAQRGNEYKILRWAYPDKADYKTDRAITNTFGW